MATKKATKSAKKKPAKKAAKPAMKKPAMKKPAMKKPAKKAARPAATKSAKKPAKKKEAKPAATKSAKKPAKKPAKPAAKPAKKAATQTLVQKSAKKAERKTLKALPPEQHIVVLPAKKQPIDLASLTSSYQGGDALAHAVTTEQMDEVKAEGLRGDGEILGVEDDADVAPCRLVDHGEGRFSLCFDDFKMPAAPLFQERGLQGGGYTWEAIANSMLRMRRPDLADQVGYDSESGMFVAVGTRANLMVLARLLQEAVNDKHVLKAAVDAADPDRLE